MFLKVLGIEKIVQQATLKVIFNMKIDDE